MADTQPNMTEEQTAEWIRTQFQAASKYLAEQGIIPDQVLTKESRYLVPVIAIWKFTTQDRKKVWVINGEVPTDLVGDKAATEARDALRHFALRWQMQAEAILQDKAGAGAQSDYAQFLIKSAENVYSVVENEELWQQQA